MTLTKRPLFPQHKEKRFTDLINKEEVMAKNKNSRELDELQVSLLDDKNFLKGIIDGEDSSKFSTKIELGKKLVLDALEKGIQFIPSSQYLLSEKEKSALLKWAGNGDLVNCR